MRNTLGKAPAFLRYPARHGASGCREGGAFSQAQQEARQQHRNQAARKSGRNAGHDAATDTLEHHCAIRESGWKGRVIPTFRPDAQFKISSSEFDALGASDYSGLVRALAERRAYFKQLGATATDHGHP